MTFVSGFGEKPRNLLGSDLQQRTLNEERLKKIVLQEAYRTIKMTGGGQQVDLPVAIFPIPWCIPMTSSSTSTMARFAVRHDDQARSVRD
jgi:hypothetical protein